MRKRQPIDQGRIAAILGSTTVKMNSGPVQAYCDMKQHGAAVRAAVERWNCGEYPADCGGEEVSRREDAYFLADEFVKRFADKGDTPCPK